MAQLIKSIPITGLNLLGVGAQPVVRMDRQLRSVFAQSLGQSTADLFARPVMDTGGGPIDWYAPDGVPQGTIQPLRDLPEPQRAQIRAAVEAQLAAIRAYATRLASSKDPNQVRLADRIEKAAQFPSDDFIFVVGGRPVITCWGCVSELPDRVATELARPSETPIPQGPPSSAQETVSPAPVPPPFTPEPPPASPPPPKAAAAPEHRTYESDLVLLKPPFPWASALAMMALFLFLAGVVRTLIPACGIASSWLPESWSNAWCQQAIVAEESRDAERETAELERQLREIQDALAAKSCDIPQVPKPPQSRAAPRPNDVNRDIVENQGKIGEINVTLRWSGSADLDLNVTCPGGQRIDYSTKTNCGGELDVDMNYTGRRSETPIENVVFPEGKAAKGEYQIGVVHSGYKVPQTGQEPVAYEIIIKVRGREQRKTGTIANGARQNSVTTFTVD